MTGINNAESGALAFKLDLCFFCPMAGAAVLCFESIFNDHVDDDESSPSHSPPPPPPIVVC
ncbi:hypothetical protein BLOT_014151 [Blomia tropicalis]|nr:hypothetical protein BLOT_014151 [Blomia tropicalis]